MRLEEEIQYCGICFKKEDATNAETIDWIQFYMCKKWLHKSCISSDTVCDDFLCQYCIPVQ